MQIFLCGFCDGIYRVFRGTVDYTTGVRFMAGDRSDIDNVTAISLFHSGNNQPGHGKQPFYVGIDHAIPVIKLCLVNRIFTNRQTGIIDKYIHGMR